MTWAEKWRPICCGRDMLFNGSFALVRTQLRLRQQRFICYCCGRTTKVCVDNFGKLAIPPARTPKPWAKEVERGWMYATVGANA